MERSRKWLQGKALPRAVSIYDDWAEVLGTSRSGSWLAACTLDAFMSEICTLYDADPVALMRQMKSRQGGPSVRSNNGSTEDYVCGNYGCYSMAWSPYYKGHVIRGALRIEPRRHGSGLSVTYEETMLGKLVAAEGTVILSGRTVHFVLGETAGMPPLFMSLFRPGPPASVLCGVMSGATGVSPQAQPSTRRIALVRVPDAPGGSNRYFLPIEGAIGNDLLAVGLQLDDLSETDAFAPRFS